jgi:hypothetical protein
VAAPQGMDLGNISADRVRLQVEKISRSWTTIGMEPYSDGVWHRKPAVGFLREWRLRVASHAVNYRRVRSLSAFPCSSVVLSPRQSGPAVGLAVWYGQSKRQCGSPDP